VILFVPYLAGNVRTVEGALTGSFGKLPVFTQVKGKVAKSVRSYRTGAEAGGETDPG
jgi:hypothetical protein